MIKLAEIRKENGISQKEFAEFLGISQGNLCEWEKGRIEPSIDFLKKISNYFHVSVDYIVGLEDDFGVKQYEEKSVSALTWDKKELLDLYDLLPEERKEMLRYTAKDYVDICKQRGLINSNKVSYKK